MKTQRRMPLSTIRHMSTGTLEQDIETLEASMSPELLKKAKELRTAFHDVEYAALVYSKVVTEDDSYEKINLKIRYASDLAAMDLLETRQVGYGR